MIAQDTDRAAEETLSARDRVLAAINALGEAGPNAIQETCVTLTKGTVKNAVSKLRGAGVVYDTGVIEPGGGKVVAVADQDRHRHRTFNGDDDDDDSSSGGDSRKTVAGLFADPPDWFRKQLEVYREDPGRHLRPLCATVAAVVLEDGARGHEVREEVEKSLAKLEE